MIMVAIIYLMIWFGAYVRDREIGTSHQVLSIVYTFFWPLILGSYLVDIDVKMGKDQ